MRKGGENLRPIAMLEPADRMLVEAIRSARSIKLVIDEGTGDERQFVIDESRNDIQKFKHDLRLTVQDFINQEYKRLNYKTI